MCVREHPLRKLLDQVTHSSQPNNGSRRCVNVDVVESDIRSMKEGGGGNDVGITQSVAFIYVRKAMPVETMYEYSVVGEAI